MKDNSPFSKIKDWLEKSKDPSNQKLNKSHYFIIVLILGIAFMLFSNFFSSNKNQPTDPVAVNSPETEDVETVGKSTTSQPSTMADYERYYENQLKEALETIVGVESVSIVVNVESSEKVIYEKNVVNRRQITDETDANGGKRSVEDITIDEQMVFTREGDKEVPIIYTTEKPDIKGVLVVARGADNIQVKKNIIEAVMRTLDVPSHRVSVQAKK